MMAETKVKYPVDVYFDARGARASTDWQLDHFDIHLSSRASIKKSMPHLSEDEVKAKIISQAAEEICHDAQMETCHDNPKYPVVSCTLKLLNKHLTKKQMRSRFIQEEKIPTLEEGREHDIECVEWRK